MKASLFGSVKKAETLKLFALRPTAIPWQTKKVKTKPREAGQSGE
jgi:hypothetical protein